MTSSETRALTHSALLILGLALLRVAAGGVGTPVSTQGGVVPDSSGLEELLYESRERRDEAQRRAAPLTHGERIDPNTALEEDLDRLPGVGPAVAGRIVKMRREQGPFTVVSDLLLVPGVGQATLAKITPYLELPTGSTPGAVRGASSGRFDAATGAVTDPIVPLGLNRASREELERLPGIGPVIADRILTVRKARGGFRSLEELQSVQGIGSATIERLSRVLVIER
jgi:competence ComEA-like helix-hairpin-helix protein